MRWNKLVLVPIALLALPGCELLFGSNPDPEPEPDGEETPTPAPDPSAIDDACRDIDDPGDPSATDGEIAGLVRINCYRRLMGLDEVRMDPLLNVAARAHAAYQDAVGTLTHEETDTSQPDYTGQWGADRATAAGYVYDAAETNIQELVAFRSSGADAAGAVDEWVGSVYHRLALLDPDLDAVGLGQAGIFDSVLIAAPWEADTLQTSVFPSDEAYGIRTTFDSDTEYPDPAPTRGEVGYPISLQFQGPWTGAFEDPYQLSVDAASTSLSGPSGAVDFDILTPSSDDTLRRSVFLLPHEPLAADADYDVRIVGEANGASFDESVSFSTAAD